MTSRIEVTNEVKIRKICPFTSHFSLSLTITSILLRWFKIAVTPLLIYYSCITSLYTYVFAA